jgi:hypothetical protein
MESEQRFWSKVQKTRGCWLWSGSKCEKGYGRFAINRKPNLSHRVSWELSFGKIRDGLFVLHRCDNPSCVRPNHLFLGTQKDNMADMHAKKRAPVGEKHYHAKLRADQVLAIRKMHADGISYDKAAKLFNVHRITIAEVVRRETWKHI